jgi:hypothetical protein
VPRFPLVGRPEARRVRGEHLVGEHQPTVLEAELHLGVRDEDAAFGSDLVAARQDRGREVSRATGHLLPHLGDDGDVGHRLVVLPHRRLGRGGEHRLGQPGPVDQALGQAYAAHVPVDLVLPQAPTGEVGAGDALHRQHLEAAHEHRAAGDLGGHLGRHDVVGHEVGELLEPPQRQLGQHRPLVRNRGLEDEVERRQPVAGHEEQLVVAPDALLVEGRVEVADLAGVDVHVPGQLRRSGGRHGGILPAGRQPGHPGRRVGRRRRGLT